MPQPPVTLVDLDVHHCPLDVVDALSPYLPTTYQDRLTDYGFPRGHGQYADDGGTRGWHPGLLNRPVPERRMPGGAAAWDPRTTGELLFDDWGVTTAVLTGGAMNGVQGMPDLDYGAALCRAFNDWTRDTWLAADDRYRFAMSVVTQDVNGAVAEIDRIGGEPGICGVLMPTGSGKPFGHRDFDPIVEALVGHDLPMVLHRGGDGEGVFGGFTTGAGTPTNLIEAVVAQPARYEVHLENLVFEGVFERHPTLRVVLVGSGFDWVPPYLWRMDLDWKGMRWHTPWVRRLPSEYVREHVWFGTGPFAEAPDGERLHQVLDWLDAGRLVFASGYPQWDADDPRLVCADLPEELVASVGHDNAVAALRL